MHSIRTKFAVLTVCEIIFVIVITGILGIKAISDLGNESSNQILFLLCEDEEKKLDSYFKSVEQSAKTVSAYAEADLKNTSLSDLEDHLLRVETLFEKTARNTNGVLTYYYRTDPAVHASAKGFWYVYTEEDGFSEHEVTDITMYDTNDQSSLVWFTVPKATGQPVWLPPYFTENLGAYVLSYNIPVYKDGVFFGVIGIEIDYNTIAEHVNSIEFYENGYAFINDSEKNIICHPRMDLSEFTDGKSPKAPEGIKTDDIYIRYNYNGVEKLAVQLPLHNGMNLVTAVPVSEISASWLNLLKRLIAISLLMIIVFALFTMRMAEYITKPLKKLTQAAAQLDSGNYDFDMDYNRDDEVGALAKTFSQMAGHLKVQIKELNDLAYSDPLTSIHNKGAFYSYIQKLQSRLTLSNGAMEFAIGIFDCNNLKQINDELGHKKGDLYLKSAASIICRTYSHSPVFRVGGDEFALILQKEDFKNRKKLMRAFEERVAKTASAKDRWHRISIASGIAVYDSKTDRNVDDVIRRADALMYKNKRLQKKGQN